MDEEEVFIKEKYKNVLPIKLNDRDKIPKKRKLWKVTKSSRTEVHFFYNEHFDNNVISVFNI